MKHLLVILGLLVSVSSFAGERRINVISGYGADQDQACADAKTKMTRAYASSGQRIVKTNPCECRKINPSSNNGNTAACSIDHVVERD